MAHHVEGDSNTDSGDQFAAIVLGLVFLLRRLLGSEADADDIAQETFLAAWTHARSFRDEAKVRTWLCGIAWRKAKAAQRSRDAPRR